MFAKETRIGKMPRWIVGVIAFVAAVSGQRAFTIADATIAPRSTFTMMMQSWIGTWSCTKSITGTKTVQWTETATAFGEDWLKFTGVDPAEKSMQASAYESVLRYDRERHQWVTVTFIADGTYGIDRGTSGGNAMSVMWVNAYPVESHVPATQLITRHGFTVDGTYNEAGKPISFLLEPLQAVATPPVSAYRFAKPTA
jgi:hypothetical protein